MAMLADVTWEIQTGGNDLNGGGFVASAAGTNYSLNAGKNVATGTDDSTTDVVTNGTTTITSATANFGATSCLGNVIYLQGGTGAVAAARYRIVTRTNATTVVLDRSTGLTAGTGVTMNIGGALLSPAYAFHATQVVPVAGNKFYIKAGTYSITTASTNVVAGCITSSTQFYIKGYQTTREDLGTPPVLQASGISAFTIINLSNTVGSIVKNITCDGAGLTTSRAFLLTGATYAYYCKAINCTNAGFQSNSLNTYFVFCSATGCSAQPAFVACNAYGCVAFSNTITGFGPSVAGRAYHQNCISYANSGASSDGYDLQSNVNGLTNCVAYNNGRHGFRMANGQVYVLNCIAEGHTAGFGFTHVTNEQGLILQSCAGFNNNSGNVSLGTGSFNSSNNFVTGSASFFTAPGSGDFSLNSTSGGGAAVRALGLPGVFPEGLTTGFLDIGAAQHADPAPGGGGEHSAVF